MPWRRSGRPLWITESASSKTAYIGIKTVNLWVAAELCGFTSPLSATSRQWSELGAQVIKGAKSELVIFYKEYDVEPSPDVADDNGKRRVARAARVFNVAAAEGSEDPEKPERLGPIERIDAADRSTTACMADVRHGGEHAHYNLNADFFQMPEESLFCGTGTMSRDEVYYAVLLHELTHWTGHKSRCDRDLSGRFGKEAYAAEELVAEIGSAMLCAEIGVTQDTRPDHVQYIANWRKILKSDPKAILLPPPKAARPLAISKPSNQIVGSYRGRAARLARPSER